MANDEAGVEADLIGRLGENYFDGLGIAAKLLPTMQFPDKTGKDRILEFPLEAFDSVISYDSRPPPRQLVFQIKTVGVATKRVALSLTVAERLAKDPRPAVVAILVIRKDRRVIRMRFIHLLDEPLAKILRRLRETQAKGQESLHRSTVSFTIKEGRVVGLRPDSLRDACSEITTLNLHQYTATKQRQLQTVGFDRFNRVGIRRMTTQVAQDVYLGLVAPPAPTEFFERRFDILVPIAPLDVFHALEVRLQGVIPGTLSIEAESGSKAKLKCQLTIARVPVADQERKLLFKGEAIHLLLEGEVMRELQPTDTDRYRLTSWSEALKFHHLFTTAPASLRFEDDVSRELFQFSTKPLKRSPGVEPEIVSICEIAEKLRIALNAEDAAVSLGDVADCLGDIPSLMFASSSPDGELYVTGASTDFPVQGESAALVAMRARFLNRDYAASFRAKILMRESGGKDRWHLLKEGMGVVEPIRADERAFDNFLSKAQALSGLSVAIVHRMRTNKLVAIIHGKHVAFEFDAVGVAMALFSSLSD